MYFSKILQFLMLSCDIPWGTWWTYLFSKGDDYLLFPHIYIYIYIYENFHLYECILLSFFPQGEQYIGNHISIYNKFTEIFLKFLLMKRIVWAVHYVTNRTSVSNWEVHPPQRILNLNDLPHWWPIITFKIFGEDISHPQHIKTLSWNHDPCFYI